jgi:hypothetical protein
MTDTIRGSWFLIATVVWSAAKARLDANKRKTLLKRLLDGLARAQAHLNRRQYRRREYVQRRLDRVCTGAAAALVEVTLTGTVFKSSSASTRRAHP